MTATEWLTLVLVAITGFYAWATLRILKANEASVAAMRDQQEAEQRPYIAVRPFIRPGTTLVCLELCNDGRSAATDVCLSMSESYLFNGEEHGSDLAKAPAFTRPINGLSAGARHVYILGAGHQVLLRNDTRCPMVFTVKAAYKFGARTYSEDCIIDLHPMVQATSVPDPVVDELKNVVNQLKTLQKTVANLSPQE
jgi:hypothetical protein